MAERTYSKPYVFLIYLVLAVSTFVAYEQVRHNDFVDYDDDRYVTENPHVMVGLTRESVIWAFTTGYANFWHPLTWLSYMLDCQLFGTNPGWQHLTNVLFHIANTLLLFAVFKRMTGALWSSAFVAALFGLHPLHVESVAWIAQRKDVLSTFFWMLTMWAYVRYVKHPSIPIYLLALLSFTLGLMAKPMLVTLPFVLLLLDYWPLGRIPLGQDKEHADVQVNRRVLYHLIWEKIPFFALAAVSSVVAFIAQRSGGSIMTLTALPIKLRIFNAFVSYVKYIVKMIWPSRLAVFYPHPIHDLATWQVAGAMLLLLAISILVFRLATGHRYLLTGWLWYLGTLVPVIGLVQVGAHAMADRYTYITLTGLFIIIAWGLPELLAKWRYRTIGLGISASIVLAVLLICTRIQVRYWQNSLTLFGHTLAITEKNFVMHNNYGQALAKKGQLEEAARHLNEALRLMPAYPEARNNLGGVLFTQGKIDEAITCFTEVLRIKPNRPVTHYNLGVAYLAIGKYEEAIQSFEKALRLKPDFYKASHGMAVALKLREQAKTKGAVRRNKKEPY